jgi:hypothetical protein
MKELFFQAGGAALEQEREAGQREQDFDHGASSIA